MEVIHTSPTSSQYIPLSTFQSQTPDSFHSGPPILYHHTPSTTLKILARELNASPTLSTLAIGTQNGHTSTSPPTEEDEASEEEIEISGIDIWVTSSYASISISPSLPRAPHGIDSSHALSIFQKLHPLLPPPIHRSPNPLPNNNPPRNPTSYHDHPTLPLPPTPHHLSANLR